MPKIAEMTIIKAKGILEAETKAAIEKYQEAVKEIWEWFQPQYVEWRKFIDPYSEKLSQALAESSNDIEKDKAYRRYNKVTAEGRKEFTLLRNEWVERVEPYFRILRVDLTQAQSNYVNNRGLTL